MSKKKNDELYHHGIKGQKWGVRRYQNSDGSLTAAGKVRYGYGGRLENRIEQDYKGRAVKMSKSDSAEMSIRKERRSNDIQNAVTGAVAGGAVAAGIGNAVKADSAASARNWANSKIASNYNFNLNRRLTNQALNKGFEAFRNFDNLNTPKVKPLVESAVSSMNPILLSVAAAAAITMTGYGLYNVYKNYKIAEVSDNYNIPDSKRVRKV